MEIFSKMNSDPVQQSEINKGMLVVTSNGAVAIVLRVDANSAVVQYAGTDHLAVRELVGLKRTVTRNLKSIN